MHNVNQNVLELRFDLEGGATNGTTDTTTAAVFTQPSIPGFVTVNLRGCLEA